MRALIAVAVLVLCACGSTSTHVAPIVRKPTEVLGGESRRALALVSADDDNESLANIYSLCDWAVRSTVLQRRYSSIFVISAGKDPLTKTAEELFTMQQLVPGGTQDMVADAISGAAPPTGGPAMIEPLIDTNTAAAMAEVKAMLSGIRDLSKERFQVHRCWGRGDAKAEAAEALVLNYVEMAPYGGGIRYLLISKDAERTRRGFVKLESRVPSENSRRLAAASLADERDIFDVEYKVNAATSDLCDPLVAAAVDCIYIDGTAYVDIRILPSEYAHLDEVSLTEPARWRVTRDGAPDDTADIKVERRSNGVYRVALKFRRSGNYKLALGTLASTSTIEKELRVSLEARSPALVMFPREEVGTDQSRRPVIKREISVRVTCRAGWGFICAGPTDALIRKEVAKAARSYVVVAGEDVERAFATLRVQLTALAAPLTGIYVRDWNELMTEALSDAELRVAVSGREWPSAWCSRIGRAVVLGVGGAQLLGLALERLEDWAGSCRRFVEEQYGSLSKGGQASSAGVLYANRGQSVLKSLQEAGVLDIGLSTSLDGGSKNTLSITFNRSESALLRIRGDVLSEIIPVRLTQDRPPPLVVISLQPIAWWRRCTPAPSSDDPNAEHCPFRLGLRVRESVLLPFEVGTLGLEISSRSLVDPLRSDPSFSVSLGVHPWCYDVNRRSSAGAVYDLCRTRTFPTVSVYHEAGYGFGWTIGLAVNPIVGKGGVISPLLDMSLQFNRGPTAGFALGPSLGVF